jgi:hypothetical protein
MNILAKRSFFFFLAAATAVLSLSGGAFAGKVEGSGIVGSAIVQGHKTTCKQVTETQCTADSHGNISNCHEVSTTQCTVAARSQGGIGSPFGGAATASLSLSRALPSGPASGPTFGASHPAAPIMSVSTLRLR